MLRTRLYFLVILGIVQFTLCVTISMCSFAQEWHVRKAEGTLKVVDLYQPTISAMLMYSDFLIAVNNDNEFVPSLAEDWRWINDRTIEFRLRKGVTFHNGDEFNAAAVQVNWDAYRKMKSPNFVPFTNFPDETKFQIIDDFTVRFSLPEPDALAYLKFWLFDIFAPSFFSRHTFREFNWSQLEEPGPWGAGPFRLVEGSALYTKGIERIVLEAFEDYWDPRFPRIKRVIFENQFLKNRREAMSLCRDTEGAVDIISRIRPLDTLRVAKSAFANVIKSRGGALIYGFFNQRKTDSKWRDIRLRKAVNYGINREELWKSAAHGNAYNLGGWIPEGTYGHNPHLKPFSYDTMKARSLLEEAGYPNGFKMKIIAGEAMAVETQIISRMLERIGLKVSTELLSPGKLYERVFVTLSRDPPEKQDWDCAIRYTEDWAGHTGISFLYSGLLDAGGMRWIQYDPVYEKMWSDMSSTVDNDDREERIRQMVQYIYDNAYTIPIYAPLTLYAVNKEVNFVPYKNGWLNLRETSVTDNHWSLAGE